LLAPCTSRCVTLHRACRVFTSLDKSEFSFCFPTLHLCFQRLHLASRV
jgi:hypothetical protein